MCISPRDIMAKQRKENEKYLRTVSDHKKHSVKVDFGVLEECIFNRIPKYHVIINFSVDPLHDLLEGICRYDLAKILKYSVVEKDIFSIKVLNERKRWLESSCADTNVPPDLKLDWLNNEEIVISASEMLFLMRYLNLMIGDLIQKNNKHWKLEIMLRKIVILSFSDFLTNQDIDRFDKLVHDYLSLYIEIFKAPLKPKHHFLLHYARIMRLFGPLKCMSSMRCEAKHKIFKEMSNLITSRVNICHSLALKYQLQFCHRLVEEKGFTKIVEYGKSIAKISLVYKFPLFSNLLSKEWIDCVFMGNIKRH